MTLSLDDRENKTTLDDLILRIHIPNSGEVKVDGITIYENMKDGEKICVTSKAFLINASIIENIAIGETVNLKNLR